MERRAARVGWRAWQGAGQVGWLTESQSGGGPGGGRALRAEWDGWPGCGAGLAGGGQNGLKGMDLWSKECSGVNIVT